MNYKLLFNFALLTGEIMLENGAETSRVEDTITRILMTSHCQTVESFVTPTGIFATLDHPDLDLMSYVRRIKKRSINLNRIAHANSLSRDYCNDTLSLEAAMYKMQEVKNEPEYSSFIRIIAIGLAAGFFTIVLGGSLNDLLISLICGIAFGILQGFLSKLEISKFFIDILGGALGAFISFMFFYELGFGDNFDLIVISSIMPMVPGVAITNAIRDTLHGDLLSGVARATDAFIVAASIATGVGLVLKILL